MNDIMTLCPVSLKDRGNNLAEAIVRHAGAGIGTYNLAPRVVDSNGNVYYWANVQRTETVAGEDWDWIIPDLGRDINLADATALLYSAVVIEPEMVEEGGTLPSIVGKFVISSKVGTQALLSAYGLINSD